MYLLSQLKFIRKIVRVGAIGRKEQMMQDNPFVRDHSPRYGEPERLDDDLIVLTANNPGPMTFTGTRTYVLGTSSVAIIDPGPRLAGHKSAIIEAVGGRPVEAVLVTHGHVDHTEQANDIATELGADVYACSPTLAETGVTTFDLGALAGGEGIDPNFQAEQHLNDGSVINLDGLKLEAIHTPGHLSDHMCFSDGKRLFCGDHVMGWATSMISPPQGSLTAFMSSLEKLLDRDETYYLPGHGPTVTDGPNIVRHLLSHRKSREAQILECLAGKSLTIENLTSTIYRDLDKSLHKAAARNVLAHLIDLYERGVVTSENGGFSADATFHLA